MTSPDYPGRRHDDARTFALQHLRRLGAMVLAHNWPALNGAVLDLIAREYAGVLVFVDVRVNPDYVPPAPAVAAAHAYAIRAAADEWEDGRRDAAAAAGARNRPRGPRRFDVIAVDLDAEGRLVALDHIKDAS